MGGYFSGEACCSGFLFLRFKARNPDLPQRTFRNDLGYCPQTCWSNILKFHRKERKDFNALLCVLCTLCSGLVPHIYHSLNINSWRQYAPEQPYFDE
jgi:hypothetical protein